MTNLKEEFKRDLEELRRTRDELKVQAHLGKKEALEKLEPQWLKLESTLEELGKKSAQASEVLESTAKKIAADLKGGYLRLKNS